MSRRSGTQTQRIRVDGVFLDEVRTRLDYGHETGSFSMMLLPAKHHRLLPDDDGLILRLPAITALQLYHDGVLPVNRDRSIELMLGGKKVGRFFVESLRRVAGYEFGEPVLLHLTRADDSGVSDHCRG